MSENVIRGDFGGAPFPQMGALYEAVWDAIMEFEGQVPVMSVIGVLRLVEHHLLTEVHNG